MSQSRVRTLVVDDSVLVRSIVRRALSSDPQIEVVGQAADGVEAIRQIKALRPDVVTLDVEMPRLNGLAVLQRAAGRVPVSFLMVSTLTQSGAQVTLEALESGAFDYITKPKAQSDQASREFAVELCRKVRAAGLAKGRTRRVVANVNRDSAPKLPPNHQRGWLVAIGISCGGPQTLIEVLPAFPSEFPPIVITQHMPAEFTASFADRLNSICAMTVQEAKHNEKIQPGRILIAPGSHHLKVVRRGIDLYTDLDGGPKVSRHRPSVDVMFSSIVSAMGARTIAVLMTGMGEDGARGMGQLHEAGAWTIAQNQETSLVYGMPRAAVALGVVDHQVAQDRIPFAVAKLMQRGARTAAAAPA
jgi:two-component system chemotaxis response regulator CheB